MTLRYDPNGRTFITDEGDHIGYLRLNALEPGLGHKMAAGPVMFEALKAAVAHDEAISQCANDPDRMSSFCTAQGDTLDTLYADWIDKSRAALERAKP